MKFLLKYWYLLRRLRVIHYVNNLKHYNLLKRNKPLYKEVGLQKSVLSSVSRKDFSDFGNKEIPWLDQPEAVISLKKHPDFCSFNEQTQKQLENWVNNGFMVLENEISHKLIDKINTKLGAGIDQEKLLHDYTNSRVMNAHKEIGEIISIAKNEKILKLLDFTMGRKVVPFQTINFINGSKAKAHSDFIHMTTEPLGYLCAIWVALEDIHPDSGPVHYYPGSHKLQYLFNEDFETGNTRFMVGDDYYENYTDAVEKMVAEKGLQKVDFIAKKGDVLIWHANLLHGGTPVVNPELTRKSLVVHYFCENVICYHEITQRPAIIKPF